MVLFSKDYVAFNAKLIYLNTMLVKPIVTHF